MKKFQLVVILLLSAVVAGLAFDASNIEARVALWERRVQSAQYKDDINTKILDSNTYSRDCLSTARMLATENGILCEREQKLVAYIAEIEEKNARLKSSLKEAVESLESNLQEINRLSDELSKANFRLEALEAALKLIPTPAKPDDVDTPSNEPFQDYESAVGVLNTVGTVLSIVL